MTRSHPPIDISVDGPVTTISMVYEPYNLVGPNVAAELGNGPTIAQHATKQLVRVAVDHGVRAAADEMADIQQAIWRSDDPQHRSPINNPPPTRKGTT